MANSSTGDVGGSLWEELDVVTPGANYGWPLAEGLCDGCGFVNPIYAYPHTPPPAQAGSITSVMVYTGSTFGPDYQNKVFIADYTLGWIKELTFDSELHQSSSARRCSTTRPAPPSSWPRDRTATSIS